MRCPRDGMKLWPKPKVRPIRFHDLRHTTASLLLMSGVNTIAVQKILRHTDPRTTTEVYGHLVPEYLRKEIDRLSFGAPILEPSSASAGAPSSHAPAPEGPPASPREPAAPSSGVPALSSSLQAQGGVSRPFATGWPRFPLVGLCREGEFPEKFGGYDCGRGGTRTHYPRLRRPVLYPDELRALTWSKASLFSAFWGGGKGVGVAAWVSGARPAAGYDGGSMSVLKHNTYFDGKVQSVGFERNGRRATVGVVAPGEYRFSTDAPERMTVVSGELLARFGAGGQWRGFPAGTAFEVPGKSAFEVKAADPAAYLCEFL